MLVTTQWPLKRAVHLTSLVWVCVLWLPWKLNGAICAMWAAQWQLTDLRDPSLVVLIYLMSDCPLWCIHWSYNIDHSLAPGKFEWNLKHVIFKQILVIDGWGISYEISLIWMSLGFTGDKSTLVQVMAWCHQASSHYLSQCWLSPLSPYGVTRRQWVKMAYMIFWDIIALHVVNSGTSQHTTSPDGCSGYWMTSSFYFVQGSLPGTCIYRLCMIYLKIYVSSYGFALSYSGLALNRQYGLIEKWRFASRYLQLSNILALLSPGWQHINVSQLFWLVLGPVDHHYKS